MKSQFEKLKNYWLSYRDGWAYVYRAIPRNCGISSYVAKFHIKTKKWYKSGYYLPKYIKKEVENLK